MHMANEETLTAMIKLALVRRLDIQAVKQAGWQSGRQTESCSPGGRQLGGLPELGW